MKLVFLFFFVLGLLPTFSATEERGAVISLRNKALACAPGQECRGLNLGSDVLQGDSLKTFIDSRLVVRFGSGSRAEMGPNSLLVLENIRSAGKKTFARWGEFDFDVKNRDSKGKFQVRTPIALAGAEGTKFKIIVDSKTGASLIKLFEGSLRVSPQQKGLQEVLLQAGESVSVEVDQKTPLKKERFAPEKKQETPKVNSRESSQTKEVNPVVEIPKEKALPAEAVQKLKEISGEEKPTQGVVKIRIREGN